MASQGSGHCATARTTPFGVFQRYRVFLLSTGTLITAGNALLLLAGFVAGLAGYSDAGRWLYLASALVGGAPIIIGAVSGIVKRFDLTADVMVSIATVAALIVGEYSAAAQVVLMLLVGEMLEDWTAARANNALKELASLLPTVVTVRRGDEDVPVPIEEVRGGDRVLVRPGERIPVDGHILTGAAAIDQAAITGESTPLYKGQEDSVYAGTLCTDGALEICVEKVGRETTLGYIVRMVDEVQQAEAPVERVANKYAQLLTPVALAIAVGTYLVTGDIIRSITVLIVVCPCALVIATPTAIVAAVGNAARRGVLIKHAAAVERLAKVDVVALDKTGTLTFGQPQLMHTVVLNGMDATELLSLAASAERSSEHPLARAVVAAARQEGIVTSVPVEFKMLPGHGVRARILDREVVIGDRMLEKEGIPMESDVALRVRGLADGGETVVPVAVDREIAGLLVFADRIRPEAKAAIEQLKRLGVKETLLISGDNRGAAQSVGDALGVNHVYADVLPKDKVELVRHLQAMNKCVAFVGDGVNDAPALAAADVGIAMGTIGTAVAMETADIVLLTDEIQRLPYLVELSHTALRVIRVNVIFSMSMNLLAVLLSVVGIIGPVIGPLLHELSALPVVANSARLIKWKSRSSMDHGGLAGSNGRHQA